MHGCPRKHELEDYYYLCYNILMTEAQKRTDFVHRSLDVFHSFASREPYSRHIRALSATGMRAAVLDVAFDPASYEHIDFVDGAMTELPFDTESPKIGIVAARPGEVVSLTIDTHPLQPVYVEPIQVETSIPEGAGGTTFNWPRMRRADGKVAYMYRRPTVFLPYSDDRTHEFPSVLAHEFLHGAQEIDQQVRVYDDTADGELDRMVDDYNHELGAYGLQLDMFFDAIDETIMDESMCTASDVRSYRTRTLGSTTALVTRDTLTDIRSNAAVGRIVQRAQLLAGS